MKKVLAVLLPVLLLAGCGRLANGGALVLPDPEDVSGVTVSWENRAVSNEDRDYIVRLLDAMKTAKNTGDASVQDVPEGGAWLARLDFVHRRAGTSTVFLYPKGGKLLLEQPYQGIYEADGALADLVREAWE